MSTAAEQTVDRSAEFDQSLQHDHREDSKRDCCGGVAPVRSVCRKPTGHDGPCSAAVGMFEYVGPPLPVSPSVLEFRIKELEGELQAERRREADLAEELRVARERIVGFEQWAAALAKKIDELEADSLFLTGKSLAEWSPAVDPPPVVDFDESRFPAAEPGTPCYVDGCLLNVFHDGPCKFPLRAA